MDWGDKGSTEAGARLAKAKVTIFLMERFTHREKVEPNFSSFLFIIRVNLLHP